jgi:hypothetical protein
MCQPRRKVLLKRPVYYQLFVDASQTGWGASVDKLQAAGLWNICMSYMHSNYRELMAVLLALLTFQNQFQDKIVKVMTDNVTTKAYITHQGGPVLHFNLVAKAIWHLVSKRKITLMCHHVKGIENVEADVLSWIVDSPNWGLHRAIFLQVDRLFGTHTIDRFADMANSQLKRYNSRYADPKSEGVDCLSQNNWSQEMNFCCPPFRLIQSVLDCVVQQSADATIIAPIWRAHLGSECCQG